MQKGVENPAFIECGRKTTGLQNWPSPVLGGYQTG